jgi:hypothetical protein
MDESRWKRQWRKSFGLMFVSEERFKGLGFGPLPNIRLLLGNYMGGYETVLTGKSNWK